MPALPLVLVCDPGTRAESFSRALTDAGCDVRIHLRDATPPAALQPRTGAVVLLDLDTRVGTGLAWCREFRAARRDCRLCVLLPRDAAPELAAALEMGADTALAQPAGMDLLVAQLRALGRAWPAADDRLGFGALEVDPGARRAVRDGRPVNLTDAEFDLLLLLARHAGRVVTRDLICRELRNLPHNDRDRSIDLRVARIRQKLGDDARSPRFIKSVRGEGYLFLPPAP